MTATDINTIAKREIEKSKESLSLIWGPAMAKAAVDYAKDIVAPNPPQTDLILACGVGLLGKYIEGLQEEIRVLRERLDASERLN